MREEGLDTLKKERDCQAIKTRISLYIQYV